MTKDFQKINIPKLPVFTTEEGIKTIRNFFGKLVDWKKLDDLIPKNFKHSSKYKKTGQAGIFAGSLELVKEGNLKIKQSKLFDDIYIKENKDLKLLVKTSQTPKGLNEETLKFLKKQGFYKQLNFSLEKILKRLK